MVCIDPGITHGARNISLHWLALRHEDLPGHIWGSLVGAHKPGRISGTEMIPGYPAHGSSQEMVRHGESIQAYESVCKRGHNVRQAELAEARDGTRRARCRKERDKCDVRQGRQRGRR